MEGALKEITRVHTQREVVEAWMSGLPCESRGTTTDGRTLWSKDECDDEALEEPALGWVDGKGERRVIGPRGVEPRRVWWRRWRAANRVWREKLYGDAAMRKKRGSERVDVNVGGAAGEASHES